MNSRRTPDNDEDDPALAGTADLLRALRSQPPPSPEVTEQVVQRVKPLAARRRWLMWVLVAGAVLATVGYVIMFATTVE